MVDMLARRIGVTFHENRFCSAIMGHYPDEDILLVKPNSFMVSDNKESLRRIVQRYRAVDPMKSIYIYHETNMPIGEVRFMMGGRTDHNSALNALAEDLKTGILTYTNNAVDL